MGERARTDLQRGMADVEGRPIADFCRAASQLLASPQIQMIVVEHRDRVMRLGDEYLEAALAAQGHKLMVVGSSEVKQDLSPG